MGSGEENAQKEVRERGEELVTERIILVRCSGFWPQELNLFLHTIPLRHKDSDLSQ